MSNDIKKEIKIKIKKTINFSFNLPDEILYAENNLKGSFYLNQDEREITFTIEEINNKNFQESLYGLKIRKEPNPRDLVLQTIRENRGDSGIEGKLLIEILDNKYKIEKEKTIQIIDQLLQQGEIYEHSEGVLKSMDS